MSSGKTARGLGLFVTPAGVSGAALQAIYSSVDLGTSTHVSGRVSAIEGRIVLGAGSATPPSEGVLCLDFDNGRTGASILSSRSSYVMLRERSVAGCRMPLLFDFFDHAIATNDPSALVSTLNADQASTHTIKCLVGDTDLWILCANAHV